jgi:hypothetical protein
MKKIVFSTVIIIIMVVLAGCPGLGKTATDAATKVVTDMKAKYPDKILDIKVYRDKLLIAFPKDLHPMEKSSIFMDAATTWWSAYPEDKKPKTKLYCFAYDDVISEDDIGSLQMVRGSTPSAPRVLGQPGIYSLRDVK